MSRAALPKRRTKRHAELEKIVGIATFRPKMWMKLET